MSTTSPTATTPESECPPDSQLIRIKGVEEIPNVLAGLSLTEDDISSYLKGPTNKVIAICLRAALCPSGTALVNLNAAPPNTLPDLLELLDIAFPVVVKNLSDSNGLFLGICVTASLCPGNTVFLNVDTVSVSTIAGFLGSLGLDFSSVLKSINDVFKIPAAICVSAGSSCPEDTLLLRSGSTDRSTIQNSINAIGGDSVAKIGRAIFDPLTRDQVGFCITATGFRTLPSIIETLTNQLT